MFTEFTGGKLLGTFAFNTWKNQETNKNINSCEFAEANIW